MVLLAGILVGGLCVWFAIRIGFYETWAMLFNIIIAIYVSLFLAQPILNLLPEETSNLPCRDALALIVVAAGSFLILYGISYILFTSQFNVTFPKIFDILFAGFLGFFGGFLILTFAAIIIALTPFNKYVNITQESVKDNMSYAYWLFDGIHSKVSSQDSEITSETEKIIEQLLKKPQPDTQDTPLPESKPEDV